MTGLAVLLATALGAAAFPTPCVETAPCVAKAGEPDPRAARAREFLARGQTAEATSLLKEALRDEPDSEVLALLLADAYLLSGNGPWAQRTLAEHLELRTESHEAASWLAFLLLGQGALDDAQALLAEPFTGPLEVRRRHLLSLVARNQGDLDAAQAHHDAAHGAPTAFPEDREALSQAAAQAPGYLPPLAGRLELSGGWTANALAGSPADPALGGAGSASGLVQGSAWLRFLPVTGPFRPSLEGELRALGYTSSPGGDASYLLVGARPGLLLGSARTLLLAYHYEGLLLAAGDRYAAGPLWFYDTHRAEVEASLLPSLTLFGGIGRRAFREAGRTRSEVDLGLGGGGAVSRHVQLLGALTGRRHDAFKAAYDLWGASGLLSAEVRLPARWSVRLGVVASFDHYPESAGYFDAASPTAKREDFLLKASVTAFTPPLHGVRAGVGYEYSQRFSSATPYDYEDHRLSVRLQWSFSADPWLPRAEAPADHVPLRYGVAATELEERIQDLLRQDEAAQRSSSCVK